MFVEWRAVRWVKALLAVLVATAVLIAPGAALQAMPCPGHIGHEHAIAVQSPQPVMAASHSGLQGKLHVVDHKSCCCSACSVSVAVLGAADAAPPALIAVSQRYAQGDQIVRGLAFPPTIGPPRTRV